MRPVRILSCVAFGALALAACSKASTTAPAPGGGAAQKDAMGPEIPVDRMPVIKAGLWEIAEASPGKPPRKAQICEDGKRKPLTLGAECQKSTLRRTLLGKYVFDSACDMGGGVRMAMHVEAAGDFQTHYAADLTSHVSLPGKTEEVDTNHKEARYIGPCPAGTETGE